MNNILNIFIPYVHYCNVVLVNLWAAIDFEFLNMWQQIATLENTVLFIKSISIDGIKYKNIVFEPFTNMNMCFISCRLFSITYDVAVTSAISDGNEQLVYFYNTNWWMNHSFGKFLHSDKSSGIER